MWSASVLISLSDEWVSTHASVFVHVKCSTKMRDRFAERLDVHSSGSHPFLSNCTTVLSDELKHHFIDSTHHVLCIINLIFKLLNWMVFNTINDIKVDIIQLCVSFS